MASECASGWRGIGRDKRGKKEVGERKFLYKVHVYEYISAAWRKKREDMAHTHISRYIHTRNKPTVSKLVAK